MMPNYDYTCGECGEKLVIFQSMRDKPKKKCPKCGKKTLKRMIGKGAGIIFRGSGFYKTDYGRR
jgi:putative FmdB family regulatory protein